jgi:HK97 family phage prohead protease
MNKRSLSMGTDFRASEKDGEKYIEGYFAVFGDVYKLWDDVTESVDRAAFDDTLDEDIRVLVNHDTRLVLGRNKAGTASLKVDERGLWARVKINQEDVDAVNTWARVKRGDVNQASFGFEILSERMEKNGDAVHFVLEKVHLREVSVCTFPAYNATSLSAREADEEHVNARKIMLWKKQQEERIKKWH